MVDYQSPEHFYPLLIKVILSLVGGCGDLSASGTTQIKLRNISQGEFNSFFSQNQC